VREGLDAASARGLAYAPYADLVWCETSTPDIDEAKRFCDAIRRVSGQAAGLQLFAIVQLVEEADAATIAKFQREAPAQWATSSSSSRWRVGT
jgi:isocitrate lyase